MVPDQACWFDFICKDRTSGVLLARQVFSEHFRGYKLIPTPLEQTNTS